MRLLLVLLLMPFLVFAATATKTNNEISLREYVDIRFEAQDKAVQAALAAVKEENAKTERTAEKRFESVNEFRKALDDNNRTLMPRLESEHKHIAASEKIDELTKRVAANEERGRSMSSAWNILISIVMAVGTIITVVVLLKRKLP